jgi:putative nucleotidyltransferase with HDIG domain
MDYSKTSIRSSTAASDKRMLSAKDDVEYLTRSSASNGSASFTSLVPPAPSKDLSSVLSRPFASPHSTRVARETDRERLRLAIVIVVSLLYVCLLGVMFAMSMSRASSGLTAAKRDGAWVVTYVVPGGPAYDAGIAPGDMVRLRDGAEITAPDDMVLSFRGAHTLTITPAGIQPRSAAEVTLTITDTDNPLQRWTFALLGLIFIGVGGPVFVKARQRSAASAFYAFCVFTALAFALAIGAASNNPSLVALSVVNLVLFASSFAFFFFKFPVTIGKTAARHKLIIATVIGSAAVVLALYVWTLWGHASDYSWVRPLVALYLAGSVFAGVISLGRSIVAERSPEVRQQMAILLGGTAIAVGPTLLLVVIPMFLFSRPIWSVELTSLALGIMPLAFAYAITQHQLLGIRSYVRRSVVYIIMGSSVMLVFSLAATALSAMVPAGWEANEWGLISFGFFVFLIAYSFGHLQRRVERLVDRYIYHDAYDYKEALLQFSSQLASEQKLQVLADQLVERTCRLMNLVCGVLLLAQHPDEDGGHGAGPRTYKGLSTVFLDPAQLDMEGHSNGVSESVPVTGVGRSSGGTFGDAPAIDHGGQLKGWEFAISGEGTSGLYLETYAKYGEYADDLIAGLQGELSQLGINLGSHQPDTALLLAQFGWSDSYVPPRHPRDGGSLVEADGVRQVSSLADAVSGFSVTEIMTPDNATRSGRNGELDMIRSFLGVPLWTRSRFVGVLCLAGKKTGERFTADDLSLLSTLGSQAALAIYNAQLHEAREQALLDTITALAHAIEAKDGYTIQHCERMTGRAVALAQALGLPRQEVENVRLGAILHDVGKIGIPDAVLNKPGKLTPEEYEIIKQHAAIGARIVQSVGALQGVVPIVRHHQERYDGSGYPEGLAGEDIPIGARIIGVVDTYGAMTEDRVYRKAPGHHNAIAELTRLAGRQFDPVVVDAFVRLLEEHPELAEAEYSHTS